MTVPQGWEHFRTWEVFQAAVVVVIFVLVLIATWEPLPNRLLACVGIAALVGCHMSWGRRIIMHGDFPQPWSIGYQLTMLALFTATGFAVDFTGFLLFALIPNLFMTARLWQAIPMVIAANAVPGVEAIPSGTPELVISLGIAVATASGSVVIGVAVVKITAKSVERAELIERLRATQDEVSRLAHRAGAAAERERMSADIHDTVAQGLASVIMLIQAARKTADAQARERQLDLAEQTARDNLVAARGLVVALAPGESSGQVVDEAIGDFAIDSGAEFAVTGSSRPLPAASAVVLLRAAQEALRNAHKHACGAAVSVRLSYGDDSVAVTVDDNGPGFDADAPTGGFGLAGMRNRVIGVGGACAVDTRPGGGTTVRVEVPT